MAATAQLLQLMILLHAKRFQMGWKQASARIRLAAAALLRDEIVSGAAGAFE
jgi:hypothetical protein